MRVELSAAEGKHAISWASDPPGWHERDLKPLFIYQPSR
jgi:hypothetical protein